VGGGGATSLHRPRPVLPWRERELLTPVSTAASPDRRNRSGDSSMQKAPPCSPASAALRANTRGRSTFPRLRPRPFRGNDQAAGIFATCRRTRPTAYRRHEGGCPTGVRVTSLLHRPRGAPGSSRRMARGRHSSHAEVPATSLQADTADMRLLPHAPVVTPPGEGAGQPHPLFRAQEVLGTAA